MIYLISADKR